MKQLSAFLLLCTLMLVPAAFVSADSATMTASCPAFARDLSFGMADTETVKDVTALQEYLASAGYLAAGTANGTFGPKTFAAMQAFQEKNGLNAQGFFGPLTRARMQMNGCSTASQDLSFVGLDVPDDLVRGTVATWILQFSPRTTMPGTLAYAITWGDEATSTGAIVTTAGSATTTLAFFSHTYKKTGTYQPTFTITGPVGDPLRVLSTSHVTSR